MIVDLGCQRDLGLIGVISFTYDFGGSPGFPGLTGKNVFIQSLLLLGLLPIPFRTIVKPAPVVVLKSRSNTSVRFGSDTNLISAG